jgi:hypothetical protein
MMSKKIRAVDVTREERRNMTERFEGRREGER